MQQRLESRQAQRTSFRSKLPVLLMFSAGVMGLLAIFFNLSRSETSSAKTVVAQNFAPMKDSVSNSPAMATVTGNSYPLLAPESPAAPSANFPADMLKADLLQLISQAKQQGQITEMSLYCRPLGAAKLDVSIDADKSYRPASMLKVPTMIAHLALASKDAAYLDRKIVFGKRMTPEIPNNMPVPAMIVGQAYSIRDLLERMIVFSDNDAGYILYDSLPQGMLGSIYQKLGFKIPAMPRPDEDYMTLHQFMPMYEQLYKGTLLNKKMSQYALELLSRPDFVYGIVGGVPAGINVAHKHGEWKYNGIYQLHDCGIIYYQGNPYLLGVMSRGTDVRAMASVIKDVSALVASRVNPSAI